MSFLPTTGLTKNPLGIIALFVSLIYGFACLVLSTSISNLKGQEERLPLIWFIIFFPIIILIGFLFLVIKHHSKLYSPSDYGNAESFLKTVEGSKKFSSVKVAVNQKNYKNPESLTDVVRKAEGKNFNDNPFLPETKRHLELVNLSWNYLSKQLDNLFEKGYLKDFGYGIEAPEYFLINYTISSKITKQRDLEPYYSIIIRVTEDDKGDLNLIAIGKDIIEKDAENFAHKIAFYIDNSINKMRLEIGNTEE